MVLNNLPNPMSFGVRGSYRQVRKFWDDELKEYAERMDDRPIFYGVESDDIALIAVSVRMVASWARDRAPQGVVVEGL